MFGDPVNNPKGWEIKRLSEIASYFIGLTYRPADISKKGVLVLRSGNIQDAKLSFLDEVRVDCPVKDNLFVQENDILMCSRNGSAALVGKVALIPKLEEKTTFGAFMTIIRSPYFSFLFTFFQLDAFRLQIDSGRTATINQITKAMLDEVTVPLPPIELQERFAEFVRQSDKSKLILSRFLNRKRR